jgi:hypothetical protein
VPVRQPRERALGITPEMVANLDMDGNELRNLHRRLTDVIKRVADPT